jgi:two-component system cell cycle sensor histidine kinase/response regulator CckA
MPGSSMILVVDDESMVRILAERALREAGYLVLSAENGTEALELLASLQRHLDLVITDLRMPGLSGDLLAVALRQQNPDLPVLFISGTPAGAESLPGPLLLKPFTPDGLVAAVRTLLSATQAHWTSPTQEEVPPPKVL